MEKSNSKIEKPFTYKKSFSRQITLRPYQKGNTGKIWKKHSEFNNYFFYNKPFSQKVIIKMYQRGNTGKI